MFELYHGLEFTVYYPLYISALLSVTLCVLWKLNGDSLLVHSSLQRTQIRLSASDSAFIALAGLALNRTILILKTVKLKISADDEDNHFSPSF
ncbi:hypothetical protein [Mesobacillus campisalis]|uniref:hypothetical protein n=1 Tax=Mesobacillus campisalis TaxID=1408103 RepID=UPI000AA9414D|nr:hypothetical protein [Mesobacillus campisalis]